MISNRCSLVRLDISNTAKEKSLKFLINIRNLKNLLICSLISGTTWSYVKNYFRLRKIPSVDVGYLLCGCAE